MSILSESIVESIQKNLPSAVAGELSLYITQAKNNEDTIKEQREEIISLRAYESKLLIEKQTWIDVGARTNILEAKEKDLTLRESKSALIEANYRAEEAKIRAEGLYRLVELAFKSPVYRSSYSDNGSLNGQSSYRSGGNESRIEIQ